MLENHNLAPIDKVNSVLAQLKALISDQHHSLQPVKALLLQLAYTLETTNSCASDQVCSFIKWLLQDNIRSGEITSRYIHQVLPGRLKRHYQHKRELCSLFKVTKIGKDNRSNRAALRNGNGIKVLCRRDENDLDNVIDMLTRVLQTGNTHIRLLMRSKPSPSFKIAIWNRDNTQSSSVVTVFKTFPSTDFLNR